MSRSPDGLGKERIMEFECIFRLCHACGYINEGDQEIARCGKCAKAFLPFTSLEKIMLAAGLRSDAPANAQLNPMHYAVIQGLMVFW